MLAPLVALSFVMSFKLWYVDQRMDLPVYDTQFLKMQCCLCRQAAAVVSVSMIAVFTDKQLFIYAVNGDNIAHALVFRV